MTGQSGHIQVMPGSGSPRSRAELGMRCAEDNMPKPMGGGKLIGLWAAESSFTGIPEWAGNSSGTPLQFKMSVTPHRFFAILSRPGVAEDVWLSVPRRALTFRGVGRQGGFKKRPQSIELSAEGWSATLTDVVRIFENIGKYQNGQENSFLEALSTPVPSEPEPVSARTEAVAAAASAGIWEQAPVTGVYVARNDGVLSGASCLVNPTSSLNEQLAQLDALSWLPESAAAMQKNAVTRGVEAKTTPVPVGRLNCPINFPAGVEVHRGEAPAEAIRSYLWPIFDKDGHPAMEPGESIIERWVSESATEGYWVQDDMNLDFPGFRVMPDKDATPFLWTLTSRRLILSARVPSFSSGVGGFHVRFEWICGLNVQTYDYLGKQPNTLNFNVVVGSAMQPRVAVWLTKGLSRDSTTPTNLNKLQEQLRTFGLQASIPKQRQSNNGRKGILSWTHYPITGGVGMTIPQSLLGL